MPAGRPQKADPGNLYFFAHVFYWDFRRLAEGSIRWRYDAKRYQELIKDVENTQFVEDEDRLRHEQTVDEEILTGTLRPSQRDARLRDIAEGENTVRREFFCREALDYARKEIRIPGEKDVIQTLLDPETTPDQLRELCKESTMKVHYMGSEIEVSAWPIPQGSTLPTYLAQYAEQYVAALNDPRFPRADTVQRPSSRLKQFWFLSRALAGALYGVSTRTAVNLVGSLRPEETAERSRFGKPERKRIRRKYKARS
jgi:hypothetical protein